MNNDINLERMNANKKLVTCFIIDNSLLTLSMLTSQRADYTLIFRIVSLILILVPTFASISFYKKKKDSETIPYVIGYSFIIFYSYFIIFTSNTLMFTYAMPMLVLLQMFQDSRLSKRLGLIAIGANFADIVFEIAVKKVAVDDTAVEEFSNIIFVITIFVIFSYISSGHIEKVASGRLNAVKKMHEQMELTVKNVNDRLSDINEASEYMKDSMLEVNNGIDATVNAVQEQMVQTEDIQKRIEAAESEAAAITNDINETANYIDNGNKGVYALVSSADYSIGISGEVSEKLDKLKKNMGEMNEITKIIDNIAFQTNIMALNANVEASRAGEAGKGFAVVASEISNMSAKTKDATKNISEQIHNVTSALTELSTVIEKMVGTISEERKNTEETASAFIGIQQRTDSVLKNVKELAENISALTDSNREIVTSTKTISESSDEVSKRTDELMEVEIGNANALNEVAETLLNLVNEEK